MAWRGIAGTWQGGSFDPRVGDADRVIGKGCAGMPCIASFRVVSAKPLPGA